MGRHTTKLEESSINVRRKRGREETSAAEIEIDVGADEPLSKKASRKAQKRGATAISDSKQENVAHRNLEPKVVSRDCQVEPGRTSEPDAKASATGVWIGNLPWTTTKADLRTFLANHDEIEDESITRVHLPGPSKAAAGFIQQGQKVCNKGFAYVDFQAQEQVTAALTLSDTLLGERRVLIKDANDFKGRPAKSEKTGADEKISDGHPASTRIFVGNLGFDVTDVDVRNHFEQCGPISQLHVATFQDSGKCKGYGWIDFTDINAAKAAFRGWVLQEDVSPTEAEGKANSDENDAELHERPKPRKRWVNQVFGRTLRVEFAEPKDVRYKKRFGQDKMAQKEDSDPSSKNRNHQPVKPDTGHKGTSSRSLLRSARGHNVRPQQTISPAARNTGVMTAGVGTKTQLA